MDRGGRKAAPFFLRANNASCRPGWLSQADRLFFMFDFVYIFLCDMRQPADSCIISSQT